MSTTAWPSADASVNRIASPFTRVRQEYTSKGPGPDTQSLSAEDIRRWAECVPPMLVGAEAMLLAVRPVSAAEFLWKAGLPPASREFSETYPLPREAVLAPVLPPEDEWEHYEEPLWDPVREKARRAVREFYGCANADS